MYDLNEYFLSIEKLLKKLGIIDTDNIIKRETKPQ